MISASESIERAQTVSNENNNNATTAPSIPSIPSTPSIPSIPSSTVYLVFAVSGATALIYQALWSRWLGWIFGNTSVSIAVVLGAFMCGLALGSMLVGRMLQQQRIANPLRGYAFAELGIGAFAVVFPLLSHGAELLFTALVDDDSPQPFAIGVRVSLAFALLVPPTALMGMTLPLLTEFFRRHPRASSAWKPGALYAVNTLGAATGVIASSFVLIELLGIVVTTTFAALLNFAVAATAWRFSAVARDEATLPPPEPSPSMASAASTPVRMATAVLAATGALALAAEVLWTRVLESYLGTSTYAFATILVVFLLGIAGGSAAFSRLLVRLRDPRAVFFVLACVVAFMGAWIATALWLFADVVLSIDEPRGEPVALSTILGLYIKAALLLLPLPFASGACFPLATRLIDPSGDDARGALIARAYAWNTWGAVCGSLIAGFVLAPLFDYDSALWVLVAAYAAIALATSLATRSVRVVGAVAVLAVVSVAMFVVRAPYVQRIGHFDGVKIVSHEPGMQGITTVLQKTDAPLASALYVNGLGMTVKVTDTKVMAHLPMLLHPDPQDTLVICFGMGTTYRSALSHGGRVTVVELVRGVLDAFPHFYADADETLANPRGRRVVNDGRNFLLTTEQRFDIITLDPPPPIDGAGVNNLYSRDFVELARSRLKPGGVFAHWVPLPGSQGGVDDQQTNDMLVDTIAGAFPHVYTLRGYTGVGVHIVGSMQPLDVSQSAIVAHLQRNEGSVARDLRELADVPTDYFKHIVHYESPETGDLIVTDDRPLLEFSLLRTWRGSGKKVLVQHMWK